MKIDRSKKASSNHSDLEGGVLQRNNIHLLVCDEGKVGESLKALVDCPETKKRKCKYALVTDGKSIEAENLIEGETLVCDYEKLADHFGFFLPLAGITTVKEIRNNAFDIKATSRLNRLYVELLRHNPEWDTAERREEMNHFFSRLIFCFFAEDTGIFNGNNLFTKTVEQMSDGTNAHEILTELFRAMNTSTEERKKGSRSTQSRSTQSRSTQSRSALRADNAQTPSVRRTEQKSRSALRADNEPSQTDTPDANGSESRATKGAIGSESRATKGAIGSESRATLPNYATQFPYVNGGLFSGSPEAPKFTKIARSYLIHVGHLDWTQINPDIFGSMIQAVADDEERGALGMHYTSVPNILKVLNPLFLDDLRTKLEEAGDNKRKLLNLRNRMARIRVFDPACGSGNFLVIAYKEMREIEAKINKLRGEDDRRSDIPLTNFRGIELRHFSAEIARLALIIAEYQCDVLHRGQKLALLEFLPLDAKNWITCGNALRLDWLKICPPTGTGVKITSDDLFSTPLDQTEMDFENEGGETFICGNPPYLGATWQTKEQKDDLQLIFEGRTKKWKSLDYVSGWFMKAADYGRSTQASTAFVATNSICQGQQVPILWPLIFQSGHEISFAHTSFKWANLASHNAGVIVVVVGLSTNAGNIRLLFTNNNEESLELKRTENINAYLVPAANVEVSKRSSPLSSVSPMTKGNQPTDGGNLLLTKSEASNLIREAPHSSTFIRRIYGSAEFIRGIARYCLWIPDSKTEEASSMPGVRRRIEDCRDMRLKSPKAATVKSAENPHRFGEIRQSGDELVMIVPSVSSVSRQYLPIGFLPRGDIVTNLAFSIFDSPLWNLALIASKLHLAWIATVCGKLKTDYRYSNTLGWNTFPVPTLTDQNKHDLTECAENILLARASRFPASIADLYDPAAMPANLREAHERNDETLERIYIGRRFKNDTERLEKLFEMYTKMTSKDSE